MIQIHIIPKDEGPGPQIRTENSRGKSDGRSDDNGISHGKKSYFCMKKFAWRSDTFLNRIFTP